MKILWVCNMMLPVVAAYLNRESSHKEGWLTGLMDTLWERQQEKPVELHVAFPVEKELDGFRETVPAGTGSIVAYGFYEDTQHPETYDSALEKSLAEILRQAKPDVIHCFGTEYAHSLALLKCCPRPERVLVGIQGVCQVIARDYMADVPKRVQQSNSFRDLLKRDGLMRQQQKFALRGQREREVLRLAHYVAGRTEFDRYYAKEANPRVHYEVLNETLRECFYEGRWSRENSVPHSIFLSQGDYPLKGLHYMLTAAGRMKESYPDLQLRIAGNSLVRYESMKDKIKISGYGRYLRQLIRDNHLEEHVTFLGTLNAEQMKEQYLKCSVYVCCSANENSPNSLGEAMLLGVPCVAADVGGIPSIFTAGEDGILYQGKSDKQDTNRELERIANALREAIVRIWEHPEITDVFCKNARKHAERTHEKSKNEAKMMEIYAKIVKEAENSQEGPLKICFISNYINHHQIPFCDAMAEQTEGNFFFIQTREMEEERLAMGWQADHSPAYVHRFYEEPDWCREKIAQADVALFGGCEDESYIVERLRQQKPVIRVDERMYKEGQWKAVSPKGLIKKYHDHTRYRRAPVYFLCAGAYVADDLRIIQAYPGKKFCWGYFPPLKTYEPDRLMEAKRHKTPHILWAGRFIDWKHPFLALEAARYLKEKGIAFELQMIGGGVLEREIRDFISRHGLEQEVRLLGYQEPDRVREYMEQANIFLMTSDRREGWGAVANEAMNSGCALVADVMTGAAPYLIRHGENGYVYKSGNKRKFFSILEELVKDCERCERLGRNAYETILQTWNAKQAAAGLRKLTEDVVLQNKSVYPAKSDRPMFAPCAPAPEIPERKMYKFLIKRI
ncbi:MAG: glycosyltransferase family 4 protein [Roseburia sp.]|nr:glycosyltransferase family 4 protein [Roseburia sp.]